MKWFRVWHIWIGLSVSLRRLVRGIASHFIKVNWCIYCIVNSLVTIIHAAIDPSHASGMQVSNNVKSRSSFFRNKNRLYDVTCDFKIIYQFFHYCMIISLLSLNSKKDCKGSSSSFEEKHLNYSAEFFSSCLKSNCENWADSRP